MDMIDQIGGWRSVGGVATNYGHGYSRLQVERWLRLVLIPLASGDGTYTLGPF